MFLPRDKRRNGRRRRVRILGPHLRLDLRGEGGGVARGALDGVRRQRLEGPSDFGEDVALLLMLLAAAWWDAGRGRDVVQVARR